MSEAASDLKEPELGVKWDPLSVCEYQLRLTLEFVQMADRKARFLMRIGLGLFAATFVGLPPSLGVLQDSLAEGGGSGLMVFWAVLALYGLCVTCLIVAMMKVVNVVRPRILKRGEAGRAPFFFQSIAQMELGEYKRMMGEMGPEQAVDEMRTMIYHNSVVADQKFRKLDEAVRWMLGGGLFGFIFALGVIVSVRLV